MMTEEHKEGIALSTTQMFYEDEKKHTDTVNEKLKLPAIEDCDPKFFADAMVEDFRSGGQKFSFLKKPYDEPRDLNNGDTA